MRKNDNEFKTYSTLKPIFVGENAMKTILVDEIPWNLKRSSKAKLTPRQLSDKIDKISTGNLENIELKTFTENLRRFSNNSEVNHILPTRESVNHT